jgi:hypothetical protein
VAVPRSNVTIRLHRCVTFVPESDPLVMQFALLLVLVIVLLSLTAQEGSAARVMIR